MDRAAGDPDRVETGEIATGETVELKVSATLSQLPLVRSIAATVAIRDDYDVDTIADLKLVVDEACSMMVRRALPWSTLSCQFISRPTDMAFTCSVPVLDTTPIDQRSLGWGLLAALVDDVTTRVVPEGDLARLTIEVTFGRRAAA